jgi:hypothetical protein
MLNHAGVQQHHGSRCLRPAWSLRPTGLWAYCSGKPLLQFRGRKHEGSLFTTALERKCCLLKRSYSNYIAATLNKHEKSHIQSKEMSLLPWNKNKVRDITGSLKECSDLGQNATCTWIASKNNRSVEPTKQVRAETVARAATRTSYIHSPLPPGTGVMGHPATTYLLSQKKHLPVKVSML